MTSFETFILSTKVQYPCSKNSRFIKSDRASERHARALPHQGDADVSQTHRFHLDLFDKNQRRAARGRHTNRRIFKGNNSYVAKWDTAGCRLPNTKKKKKLL